MIQTTIWHPDTCSCVIEYQWDDTTSEDSRTHDFKSLKRACPAHAAELDGLKIFDIAKEENQRKNATLHKLIQIHPSLGVAMRDENGDVTGQAPNHNLLSWSFDANRRLKVAIKSGALNNQQKGLLVAEMAKLTFNTIDSKGIQADKIDII